MENILSPEEWILDNHPDPDNIHECNIQQSNDFTYNTTYPIKEDVCYSLMQQYADYYHSEKNKQIVKQIEDRIKINNMYIKACDDNNQSNIMLGDNEFLQSLLNIINK